jgi:hypothetical protein
MVRKLSFGLLLVTLVSASAQQPSPKQTPEMQALYGQLAEELRQTLMWRAQAVAAQEQLKVLEAQLDELKKKQEPQPK